MLPLGFPLGWAVASCKIAHVLKEARVAHNPEYLLIGVGIIKTVVECAIYNLPLAVKFAKNLVAFAMDAAVMCIGVLFAKKFADRL